MRLFSLSLFSCPRQLAKLPHRRGYSTNVSDQPGDADLFEVALQEGDMVICFVSFSMRYLSRVAFSTLTFCPPSQTDGLGDNIHPKELLLLLAQASQPSPPPSPSSHTSPSNPPSSSLPQRYADALLRYGKVCMSSHDKISPFQLSAAEEGLDFQGGKIDEYVFLHSAGRVSRWREKLKYRCWSSFTCVTALVTRA